MAADFSLFEDGQKVVLSVGTGRAYFRTGQIAEV